MNNKTAQQRGGIIKRELKIEDNTGKPAKDFREAEEYLKTVSKKFMKEPLSLENLDKVYNDIIGKTKNEKAEKSLLKYIAYNI